MPKQRRWKLKRDLEQASHGIDISCEYIVRVASQFRGVHDEYCTALNTVWATLQIANKSLREIKDMI